MLRPWIRWALLQAIARFHFSLPKQRAPWRQKLVAVALKRNRPALANLVDELVWLKVGQLSKLISAFTDRRQHASCGRCPKIL